MDLETVRGAWEKVSTKQLSSRVPRIQKVRMVFQFVTYCTVRKFGGR